MASENMEATDRVLDPCPDRFGMGGNGIQQSQLLNVAGLQTVNGRTGEDAVGGAGVDLVGAAHFDRALAALHREQVLVLPWE